MNHVVFEGRISRLDALRHTPGGVPLVEFAVAHVSEQTENGMPRRVECELDAIGIGDIGRTLAGLAVGSPVRVSGFLARRSVKSAWPVLHATAVEPVAAPSDV